MTPEPSKQSNDKRTGAAAPGTRPAAAKPAPAAAKPSPAMATPLGKPPPLFRSMDWIAFAITTVIVLCGYLYTLAPDLTLEDSGELAVASYYAGVPHPPGYPVWTIYTWFFTQFLPISNIAFRVGVSSAVAGALGCGLIALMISRGSSMMIESVPEFKVMSRRLESMICIATGIVGGMLMAFDGFMWSQAVIVEVYTLTVLSLAGMLIALMRWIYAPQQHRYLYLAWFLCGICFNNHQSLLPCALAIEVGVAVVQPKLGRDLFLGNFLAYIVGLIGKNMGMVTTLNDNMPVLIIYNLIGIGSAFACIWLWIKTKKLFTSFHWALICALAFMVGAAFYLYMPIASMSNPPLNWGYPRTAAGFVHAFTRGQYERIHPTTSIVVYVKQVVMLVTGAIEEFNPAYLLIGLVPFMFFRRVQARERAWLITLLAFYVILGPFLLELLNPGTDRQSLSLNKVFFTASHVMIAMAIGYGLTLILAALLTDYKRARIWVLAGFSMCAVLALAGVWSTFTETPYWVLRYTAVFGLVLALIVAALVFVFRDKSPTAGLVAAFLLMPIYSIGSHWSENEERGHRFGFWFGHDMFTPPFKGPDGKLTYSRKAREDMQKKPGGELIYPEMTKDAILFGGTDPGRFCPTYMIFCESFIPPEKRHNPEFDRRDVYIITQNALADGTYLNYIRAHYFRSAQIDPPFFSDWMRSEKEKELNFKTNIFARALAVPLDKLFLGIGDNIEKQRRAGSSFFKPDQFTDLPGFARKLQQGEGPGITKYLRDNLSEETRKALASPSDKSLADKLASDLNRILDGELEAVKKLPTLKNEIAGASPNRNQEITKEIEYYNKLFPLYTPERFQGVALSDYVQHFIKQNPQSHSRVRLNRLLLEATYPEIAKSPGGVYPDSEIYTPSNEDSQRCFQEYMQDAQARMARGQLKPGEDVKVIDNRVQVSGQVAVMAINGLLTKVIFEKNPQNEFFVEESFPLDWMYPYLTPFGIIMKLNRQTLPELTDEIVKRDHEFWSEYSTRLIGNWITYDTPISNIVEFAERVYVDKNFDSKSFKGDPAFVRDDDGQKAFSKLRSSIAGVYAWRVSNAKSPTEQQRMIKEAEFSFKQAYAFCPYSPEALYRYVNLLVSLQRFEDAIMLARTSHKLDKYNTQLEKLVNELENIKAQQKQRTDSPASQQFAQLEAEYRRNPKNFSNTIALANAYATMGQTSSVLALADRMVSAPDADATTVNFAMQIYEQLHEYPKLEPALQKWVKLSPTPEAWLDLAGVQAVLQKSTDAITSLQQALNLSSARRKTDPNASNIAVTLASDGRFTTLRALPQFKDLLATNQ